MLQVSHVGPRPDRITRTGVIEPFTVPHYAPVTTAQGWAKRFTRLHEPTVSRWYRTPNGGVVVAPAPAQMGESVQTERGVMTTAVGATVAQNTRQAEVAVADALSKGQSVRIRDNRGRVAIAHPGQHAKTTWYDRLIRNARAAVERARKRRVEAAAKLGRRVEKGRVVVARPQETVTARRGTQMPISDRQGIRQSMEIVTSRRGEPERGVPSMSPYDYDQLPQRQAAGATPVSHGYSPAFNRQAKAARAILQNTGAMPPVGAYLPAQAAGVWIDKRLVDEPEAIARRTVVGPDRYVLTRGRADAMDRFFRRGDYY